MQCGEFPFVFFKFVVVLARKVQCVLFKHKSVPVEGLWADSWPAKF